MSIIDAYEQNKEKLKVMFAFPDFFIQKAIVDREMKKELQKDRIEIIRENKQLTGSQD